MGSKPLLDAKQAEERHVKKLLAKYPVNIEYDRSEGCQELWENYWETGHERDRENIFNFHFPLALSIAGKFFHRSALVKHRKVPFEDVVTFAGMGLIHAIDNYKPDCPNRFSTYAYHCIFFKTLTESKRFVYGTTTTGNNRNPLRDAISINEDWKNSSGKNHVIIQDEGTLHERHWTELSDIQRYLDGRDREMFRLRFRNKLTNKQIAKEMKISKQRVHQIFEKMFDKIRCAYGYSDEGLERKEPMKARASKFSSRRRKLIFQAAKERSECLSHEW